MIFIGKAPYRISLLGGGSDLDWFVENQGPGYCIGYSLDQFSYSVLHALPTSAMGGVLNYSSREFYHSIDTIVHPLIRSAFESVSLDSFVELSSYGFASGGSGLGGSSSFLLSLLAALYEYKSMKVQNSFLAKLASDIEIHSLNKPIGRQDQYFSALGGLNVLEFRSAGAVSTITLSQQKKDILLRLIDNLYLVPSSITRSADKVLQSFRSDPSAMNQFCELRNIAKAFIDSAETRDAELETAFHQAVSDSWTIKKSMSNVMDDQLNSQCNLISTLPINWIRLIGAGAGGYFLVSPKDSSDQFLASMRDLGFSSVFKAQLTQNGVSACTI